MADLQSEKYQENQLVENNTIDEENLKNKDQTETKNESKIVEENQVQQKEKKSQSLEQQNEEKQQSHNEKIQEEDESTLQKSIKQEGKLKVEEEQEVKEEQEQEEKMIMQTESEEEEVNKKNKKQSEQQQKAIIEKDKQKSNEKIKIEIEEEDNAKPKNQKEHTIQTKKSKSKEKFSKHNKLSSAQNSTQQSQHLKNQEDDEINEGVHNAQSLQQSEQQHVSIVINEFHDAIKQLNYDKINDIIKNYQDKFNILNRKDPHSNLMPIFLAEQIHNDNDCHKLIDILISNGANQHYKDHIQQNILFYLARDNKFETLKLLVQKYNCNASDEDYMKQIPLFYASREGNLNAVRFLVEIGESNPNHVDDMNQTALFYAARDGQVETCEYLVQRGCNIQHQDNKKQTAINWAKKFNRKEVVKLFMRLNSGQGGTSVVGSQSNLGQSIGNASSNNSGTIVGGSTSNEVNIKNDGKGKHKNAGTNIGSGHVQNNTPASTPNLKESSKIDEELKKRKRDIDDAKISFKLVYTDENGKQVDITKDEFLQNFAVMYPEVSKLLQNPSTLITEEMINQAKEDEGWEKVAWKIIMIMWKMKSAYMFHNPVDVVKMQCQDYYDYIKNPMDFSTIKIKLNGNVYNSCQQFVDDMKLVFENCKNYNGETSDIGLIGIQFDQEFENLCKQHNIYIYCENNKNFNSNKDIIQNNNNDKSQNQTNSQQKSQENNENTNENQNIDNKENSSDE